MFHSCHAQEGTPLTGPSIPTPSSANSKHALSTITDKETDVHELIEGKNSDGQSMWEKRDACAGNEWDSSGLWANVQGRPDVFTGLLYYSECIYVSMMHGRND